MTTPDAPQNTHAADESDAEIRCLLYLLGELDADASRKFEATLAADGNLCRTLMQQADLIVATSSVTPAGAVIVPQQQPMVPSGLESEVSKRRHWRWIAALASVAACVALVFQVSRLSPQQDSLASIRSGGLVESLAQEQEASLIAKAWAISQREATSEIEDLADPIDEESIALAWEDQPGKDDQSSDLDQSSDFDTTLSWMFVAVASGDELHDEEGNDG